MSGDLGRSPARRGARAVLAAAVLLAAIAGAGGADDRPRPEVLDEVWRLVRDQFYDRGLHGVDWEAARERHLAQARRARTQLEVHEAITAMLGELRASHTALVERDVYETYYDQESKAVPAPMFGLTIARLEPGWFVAEVLRGGPAEAAGVRRGDRVVTVAGAEPSFEVLRPLPWDSGLGGARGFVIPAARAGETVRLELERTPRLPYGRYAVTVTSALWSEVQASQASLSVHERMGVRIGYARLYHVLIDDVVDALIAQLGARFAAECDAVVVDLRGKGGIPSAVDKLLAAFDPATPGGPLWGRPTVALVDGGTRSTKEILAWEWRRRGIGLLVGTTTAGAVIGARFEPLSDGAFLLVPIMDMRSMTGGEVIEGRGVPPDVAVEDVLPWAAGRDPVLERGLETAAEVVLAARRAGRTHGWY